VSSIAGLTDRGTVAAYVIVNTTRLSGRNYTTSRDVTVVPEMVDQWNLELEPRVVLPMYGGPHVRGHGTVIWRTANEHHAPARRAQHTSAC
jgi:hypothetical protein